MKKVLISIGAALVLFLLAGLFLPSDFHSEASIEIKASKDKIYPLIGDLRQWPVWEPWKGEDPTIKTTFGATTTGVGASQSWLGEKAGDGRLTFTMAKPTKGVEFDLFFDKDRHEWKGGMRFDDKQGKDTQRLTWYMKGKMDYPVIGGYFALIVGIMNRPTLEKALKNIKKHAEKKS